MNWFSGNIAEAVVLSKTKKAIFVVFCEGSDELSTSLVSIINDDRIRTKLESDRFVAIKIQSDSPAYGQFVQLYKLVPIPSIFFIGNNGVPLEVVTGITKSVDELDEKIEKVLKQFNSPATSAADFIAGERANEESQNVQNVKIDEDTKVVCEGGVCYKQPKQNTPEESQASTSDEATASSLALNADDKVQRAKELIEKKRKEKEDEEARLAKERELQRRRLGQDLQNFKQRQEETEVKKQQEERKRDKIEDQAARKRVLEQIAADKAERAQRLNQSSSSTTLSTAQSTPTIANQSRIVSDNTVARIQFKKPDGESEVQSFDSSEIFGTIRTYVEENVIVASGIREFGLATTFPRKEFTTEDNGKSLLELGLAPSSVILILPLDKATARKLPVQTNYGYIAMLTTAFWTVLSPVISSLSYVRNWIFSRNRTTGAAKRASEEELAPNDLAKKRVLRIPNVEPSQSQQQQQEPQDKSTYRRVGSSNIHRLNEAKDSDDENNTWNGNSTQQQ